MTEQAEEAEKTGHDVRRFGRAALRIASWTLVSRVLGLVRDRYMFGLFGKGPELGAFHLAWTVPNTFRRLLGEGALSAAFVPVLTQRLDRDGVEGARRSFGAVFGALLLVLVSLIALLMIGTFALPEAWLVDDEAPGYAPLLRTLLFVLLPYLGPVCLMTIVAGAQNVRGKFALPAVAPAVLNGIWIVAVLIAATRDWPLAEKAVFVAGCVLIGGVVQLLVQVPGLFASGLAARPRFTLLDPDLRRVVKAMLPMLLGLSVLQFNTLITQFLAAFLIDTGAPSILFLGNRLLEFPHALLGVALGTAVFPLLSLLGGRGEHGEFRETASRALGLGIFFALPAAAGLFALAPWLVDVLFRSGRFDASAAAEATTVTRVLSCALPGLISVQILARTHYALDDMRTPLRIAAALLFVAQGLNVLLAPRLGTPGLALSSTIVATINAIWLAIALMRRVGGEGIGRRVVTTFARATIASVPSALAAWWTASACTEIAGASLWTRIGLLLLVPGVIGVLVFFAAARLVGARELAELRRRRVTPLDAGGK
ncbi:MAG: murein biosynthesis integral membrane protein MurJ [Planctomycetes bacterium]|nr:murein biosynthesis integral membrane protein MurJ [Planctomycetota bacterium]